MTYLNFLILFVILPSLIMAVFFRSYLTRQWWAYIGLLALIAVIWTTPWDNYLVANKVWWYNPSLVLGIIIGYVPIEEYSFFVLQTVFTGILLGALAGSRQFMIQPLRPLPWYIRLAAVLPVGILVFVLLIARDVRFNYIILTVGWLALLPIAIQWFFGLDILLQRWRLLIVSILIPTVWLTAMDSVAIGQGTWTIDPAQTVGVYLPGGIVPLEEGLFFFLTNTLIVQGLLLASAPESLERLRAWKLYLETRLSRRNSEFNHR